MKEKICLVAIVKNEEAFLAEWLVYHRMIGVDMFFIYNDDAETDLTDLLDPYNDFVKVIPWRNISRHNAKRGNQLAAYDHALKNYACHFDRVLFLDVDEFVVLKKHNNIPDLIKACPKASAISLNWHVFGHNGFVNDPPGLVTSHLTKRQASPSAEVKTITRVKDIMSIRSPHFCELRSGERVDANNQPFTDDLYPGKTDLAYIHHYKCRSYRNWMDRVKRGDVNFDDHQAPREHHWRLDENRCLAHFITKVALCYNEVEDQFMLKYRQAILNGIKAIKPPPVANLFAGSFEKVGELLNGLSDHLKLNLRTIRQNGNIELKTLCMLLLTDRDQHLNEDIETITIDELLDDIGRNLEDGDTADLIDQLIAFGVSIELLAQQRLADIDTNELLEELDDLLLDIVYYTTHPRLLSCQISSQLLYYFLIRLRNSFNIPAYFGTERYHERMASLRDAANILQDRLAVDDISGIDAVLTTLILIDAKQTLLLTDKAANYLDRYRASLSGDAVLDNISPQERYVMELLTRETATGAQIGDNVRYITEDAIKSIDHIGNIWYVLLKIFTRDAVTSDTIGHALEVNIDPIAAKIKDIITQCNAGNGACLKELANWGLLLAGIHHQRAEYFWLNGIIANKQPAFKN